MNRTSSYFFVFLAFLTYSCAGPAVTTENANGDNKSDVSQYPEWFGSESVTFQDSLVVAYATAIDSDSVASVDKAVAWAKSEMQSALSDRLENIRTDAVQELGDDSRINSTEFILALRRADNEIDDLGTVSQSEVKSVEGFTSFRSYVELTFDKEELLNHLREQLGTHGSAWQAMEESKAFQQF